MRIYVDTNVYLDYMYNRNDGLRPLGDFAFELFKEAVSCTYTIIISDWVLIELKKRANSTQISEIIEWLTESKKLVWVEKSQQDLREAKKYAHWQDALHEILAKKAEAQFLVTRNLSDFGRIRNFVQVKLPENL